MKSLSAKEVKVLLEKGIEGALFPSQIWKRHIDFSRKVFSRPLPAINALRKKHRKRVNLFIEKLLNSMSDSETFRSLETVDPMIAVLYKDRLDAALAFLEEGIAKDAQIAIPPTFSELLRVLLIRNES